MASGIDSSSGSGGQDPYSILGLSPGASFDEVQKARSKRLDEVGDDPLARARIEASYDSLLMVSLRDRQLGKVSTAAVSASKKEDQKNEVAGFGKGLVPGSLLTRLKGPKPSIQSGASTSLWPELSLPEGQGLAIRLALGLLALILLLVSPAGSEELILSVSTIGLFISQIRRGRRPLPSLGWSVVLLSLGLILGGLLIKGFSSQQGIHFPITSGQIEALPAALLLWLGALLLG